MDLTALSDFLTSLKWATAGLVGAMIVSRFHKEELNGRIDYLVFIASGAAIAHFLTAPVALWFKFDAGTTGGIGFLLGAFGGSAMQAVVRGIKSADLWSVIKNRFGGGE